MKHKLFSGMSLIVITLSGCTYNVGDKSQEPPVHEHTYSTEWSYDNINHWHAATCEHTSEVKDKDVHSFSNWIIDKESTEYESGTKHKDCNVCGYRVDEIIEKLDHTHKPGEPVEENRVEPTCTKDGSYDLVIYCYECQEELSREHITLQMSEHDWGNVIYEWNGDYSRCTATRECNNENSHVETETTDTTYEIIEEASCINTGSAKYVAAFNNEAFEQQTMFVTLKELGHDLIHHDGKEATCVENGWEYYDTCSRCDYSTYKEIPMIGHKYGEVTYVWDSDYSKCTATRQCSNDPEHIEQEISIPAYMVLIEPGETDDGVGQYTASFQNPAFKTQVEEISIDCLGSVDKLDFVFSNDYYYVKAKSTSISGDVFVPYKHNGYPVKTIDNRAFKDCKNIKSISIMDGVENIFMDAFVGCSSLEEINIPEKLKDMSYCGFKGCSSLKEIKLPQCLKTIDNSMFEGCSSLESVELTSTLSAIEDRAFYECRKLKSFIIDEGIKSIGEYAFRSCESLKEITIPSSVEMIKEAAFSDCTSLENLVLNEGVLDIEDYAFVDCKSIKKINLPDSLLQIGFSSFAGCISAEEILIGNGLSKLSDNTFNGCKNVYSIDVPESIISIGAGAFVGCFSLEQLTLPQSLCYFGKDAIYDCENLKYQTINDGLYLCSKQLDVSHNYYPPVVLVKNTCENLNFYVESGTKCIYQGAFGTNHIPGYIENVYIPSSVTYIGAAGWSGEIKSFYIDETNNNYLSDSGCIYDKNKTKLISYPQGKEDKVFNIPTTVTSIEPWACYDAKFENILNVSQLTSIGESAFASSSLIEFSITSSHLIDVGYYAFQWCLNLISINLDSDSLEYLSPGIFSHCSKLSYVYFTNSVKYIGSDYSFDYCTKLLELNYGGSINEWIDIAKNAQWAKNSSIATIHCQNGDISL